MNPLPDYTQKIAIGFIYTSAAFFGFCVGGAIGYGLIFVALMFFISAIALVIAVAGIFLGGRLGISLTLPIAEKIIDRINWNSRLHFFYAICGSMLMLVLGIITSFYVLYITTFHIFIDLDEIIAALLSFIET